MTTGDAHLTVEALIDVAEDAGAEGSAAHLAVCDRCREQVVGLRAAMADARETDVPEPSPLFWTHLSRRVGDAIANEPPVRRRWFEWTRPRVFVPVAAVAVAALVLAVVLRPADSVTAPSPSVATAASPAIEGPASDLADLESDSSLKLVADLTAGIDLDAAMDAGLTRRDSAEQAVTQMNVEELRTLQRLLNEEIARPGRAIG